METWIWNLHKSYSWIDLSDEETEGKWVDRNGDEATYFSWKSDDNIQRPNGGKTQNCVYQHVKGAGKWDDGDCVNNQMACAVCQYQCPAGQKLIDGVCKPPPADGELFPL